jgi:hypothetical protein
MNKYCFGALLALAIPLSTNAAPVTVSYSATIGFNPSATVGVGGQNAGTLINELFGPGIGSKGTATLTGVFTYESTTPALNSNSRSAGYVDTITGATATIGRSTVTADIGEIAANKATSEVGYNTNAVSGFCATREECAAAGLAFTPTGNVVQVVNDSNFFLIQNGHSVNYFDRDAIYLATGFTDSHSDFSPLLSTPSFGDVNVHGLDLTLVSNAGRSLVDSVLLPDSDSFVTSDQVDASFLRLVFSGPGLKNDFTLSGQLTNFTTSPVPEPASWAMFISGLIFVISVIGRNRRYSSFT